MPQLSVIPFFFCNAAHPDLKYLQLVCYDVLSKISTTQLAICLIKEYRY